MSATTIKLYELAGAEDERCFSPFCWRDHLLDAFGGEARQAMGYPR